MLRATDLKRLLLLCSLAALLAPAAASAGPRMWIGFQDDSSFRWRPDRHVMLDQAQRANADIVRTIVYWYEVAPKRPANAASAFDPVYRFDDLDEFVRGAQARGMEVLLTIWGTPAWANGGKGRNYAPTRASDMTAFARAVASRYSGRYPSYPFVRYYSVWNESNLQQFLAPQYDAQGRDLAPALYAKMFRAAYAGIKAGNPQALVGIGETSARGRDHAAHGPTQETHSPGRFAELLSKVRPRLQFDAWSHHPYPTSPNLAPTQKVRWPNVTLTQLPLFERSIDKWFGRKDIPVWITEYGHETRPGSRGVSYSKQAAYAKQALMMARSDPRVQMFIWFVLRDDANNAWQSGLLTKTGAKKPAFTPFAGLARLLDGRNPIVAVKAGSLEPVVRVPALEIAARSGVGAKVGVTYQVTQAGKLVNAAQPVTTVGRDGWISLRLPIQPQAGKQYLLRLTAGDINGNSIVRSVTMIAS